MFGFDWDGDGKEGLFDDMFTLDILDAEDRDDGVREGSCLVGLVTIGAVAALPIIGLIKFLV